MNHDRQQRPLRLAVLGSTGSVGRQTLEVVSHAPDQFQVMTLAARHASPLLAQQVAEFSPELVAVHDGAHKADQSRVEYATGESGLVAAATHPDVDLVVVASAGHAAIVPTMKAIEANKAIALANKETIVCAGELIMPLARRHGIVIRPVDSEHSAIWQSLGGRPPSEVARLIVTASGGPFRTFNQTQLARVTAAEALAHPTWSMGGKITIDSATLMNKGLEIIEAKWLFDVDIDRIEAVIHPESIVHSLVEFVDGGLVAQLGWPDMRLPIQYALTYPRHLPSPCRRLSLTEVGSLHFEAPDVDRFPALRLAREAGKIGGTAPTVLSAADEVAVGAFLAGRIAFPGIAQVAATALDRHCNGPADSIDAISEADVWGRRVASEVVHQLEA